MTWSRMACKPGFFACEGEDRCQPREQRIAQKCRFMVSDALRAVEEIESQYSVSLRTST